MKIVIAIFALYFAGVSSAFLVQPDEAADFLKFSHFKQQHQKIYRDDKEEELRFRNFQSSLDRAAARNSRAGSEKFGITKFSDLSPEEFKATYLNFRPSEFPTSALSQPPKSSVASIPESFDWRSKNVVTPVKDQGQCGSCWAFSVTENIESEAALAGYPLQELAPQQIVDCDTDNYGCNGGYPQYAYNYLVKVGGLEAEASYPYTSGTTGQAGTCAFQSSKVAQSIDGFKWAVPGCNDSCTNQNLTALAAALVEHGPLSICIDAQPWQDYTSGILTINECPEDHDDIDHCVQLVGFDQKQDYWLVRNSWNTNWGEEGFIRLQFSANTCGIADWATFAVVSPKTTQSNVIFA